MGDGSPGSREAEGEGGEGFYIAQSGRRPDLLVIWGEGRAGGPLNSVRTSRALGGCPPDSANVPRETRARGIAARLILR